MSLPAVLNVFKVPSVEHRGQRDSDFHNEQMAIADGAVKIVKLFNQVIGRRRRFLYANTIDWSAVTGAVGTRTVTQFFARISPTTEVVTSRIMFDRSAGGSFLRGSLPRVRWVVTDQSGFSYAQTDRSVPRTNIVSTGDPDDFFDMEIPIDGLDPGRWYQFELQVDAWVKPNAVTVWEEIDKNIEIENKRIKRGNTGSLTFSTPNVTLSGVTGMDSDDIGRTIHIMGATSEGNNGSFIIGAQTATTVTYLNRAGVTEALPAAGKWFIGSGALNPGRWQVGSEITDGDMTHMQDALELGWKHGGGNIGAFANMDGTAITTASATLVEVFPATLLPQPGGFWAYLNRSKSFEQLLPSVLVWCFGDSTNGDGVLETYVRTSATARALVGTITLPVASGLQFVATATSGFGMPPDPVKFEFAFHRGSGGTANIYALGCLLYEG
jgi:hypothetical protein